MAESIMPEGAGQNQSAPVTAAGSGDPVGGTESSTEEAFAEAVRSAMRHYLRTDLLRESPLLNSRLVRAALRRADSPTAPVQALKDVLREHCERIGGAPKLAALQRVLELTWIAPMRSQQVVAESLHLSWSTYRRRLADAMQLLIAQLWEAECALARPDCAPRAEVPALPVLPVLPAASAEVPKSPAPRTSPGLTTDVQVSTTLPVRPATRRRLRGIVIGAFAVIALTAVIAAAWWSIHRLAPSTPILAKRTGSPSTAIPGPGDITLAVLPFLDMDVDPAQQYLSDGVTEELINRLGRFEHLRVAARTSTFMFRDKPVDVRQAAHALGVANVLEGSVQRSGERLRVRVALVSAHDGYELWSDEYDLAPRDLLTVEDEIAEAVIRELHPKLRTGTLAELHMHAGLDPAAHDYYLVGLQYLNRRTSIDINQAIAYFRRAIQADPDYAPAWSGVATAYTVLRDYNSDAPPDTHYADALAAAERAAALDPQLSRPRAVLGQLYEEHWQWASAERELREALRLDPSDAIAHQWYAMFLWFRGDMQGALVQMRIARDLDPLSPIINSDYGRALIYTGDVDGAIAQYRATVALEPRFALAHLFLAEAWMAKGRYPDALAETRTAIALTPVPHPSSYLAVLGLAQALNGDRAGAREQLTLLGTRASRQYVSGVSLALLNWQFGDKDQTFANLSRAVADHDHLMLPAVAARDADWRADPRFAELMTKMGLPK